MLILIRFSGEISTKARRTRAHFVDRLAQNIEDALQSERIPFALKKAWSRLFVETPSSQALEILPRIFGIQSLSLVESRPGTSLEEIIRAGEQLFRGRVNDKRFAVRARVAERNRTLSSQEIERRLGAALLPYALKVDLNAPEVTTHVEVRDGQAYFFTEQIPGPGGLPLGIEGRAVALVSGGFDSAVAAWLLLKRGVMLDYVFCNLGGMAHQLGVLRVVKILADRWSYGDRPRLHALDFQPLVRELQAKTHSRYWQLLLKRLMYRAAEIIARKRRGRGLVTGEAVGQVSSQTLQNLYVISQAAELPLLRPLLGFNKEEIVAQARRIGTYEPSAAVEEYCAIVPRHPATHASLKAVLAEEAKLDLTLLEEIVTNRSVLNLRDLDLDELSTSESEIEIEEIPKSATIIDLRSASSYRAWHYPDAVHMDFLKTLEKLHTFDRDRTYVLYCEVGLKSAYLAERMREIGYRAFHFKGGIKNLMRYALERDLLPPEILPPSALLE